MCARVDTLHRDVTCVSHNALICALMQVLHASVSEAHEHETSTKVARISRKKVVEAAYKVADLEVVKKALVYTDSQNQIGAHPDLDLGPNFLSLAELLVCQRTQLVDLKETLFFRGEKWS